MFKKIAWFFKQEAKSYLIGILMLISVAILSSITPIVIAKIIDSMVNQSLSVDQLLYWAFCLLALAGIQYVLRYIWRMNIHGTSAKLEYILRRRLFNHFTRMDATFYQKYRTGDLMAHATNDLNAIRMVASAGILTLVDSLAQGLITLFMMFVYIDWRLSLVAIIPLPLLTILVGRIGQRVHRSFRTAQERFSSLNDKVQESVSGVQVIKTFGEEALEIQDFEIHTAEIVTANQEVYRYETLIRPIIMLLMGLVRIISIFYGGFLVSRGELSIGHLVAFLSYVSRMSWPMIAVGNLFNILERGSASYDRVEGLLAEESKVIEIDHPIRQAIKGDLNFYIDCFAYEAEAQWALKQVHFELKAGQTLGIVGKTASGKSTIFKLLLRDYDNYEGIITYNGEDIRDYSFDAFLGHIGYVPQDNFLFSTSVRDNIRFADMTASQEEIEAVARLVDVHDDIMGFMDGYETLTGEQGVALSGGQKQRIAIARALLLKPELLILDDSLSAVDAKTEEKILSNIKQYRSQQSTIITAHRISSVMHADEIIVLDQGTINERGNHEALMAADGWYAEMYHKQQLASQLEGVDSLE